MAACGTPSEPLPPQFPRDLRAAPTLPGLANPPLEGVRPARLSSVHRVKRSVCPKEPVNTSLSDLLHSTANVKPHYPPPEWSPRPNFHQWSQSLVAVEHCGVPFNAKLPHFWPASEGFVPDCVRHKARKLWHSFFGYRLQPCRSAQQSVIVKFSLALSQWFYNNISDTRLEQNSMAACGTPSPPPPPRSSSGTSEQLRPSLG